MNDVCIHIAHEVANEMGLPTSVVMEMMKSQFRFTSSVMKRGEFESIRLPYFGTFKAKPRRVQWFNEEKSRKEKFFKAKKNAGGTV